MLYLISASGVARLAERASMSGLRSLIIAAGFAAHAACTSSEDMTARAPARDEETLRSSTVLDLDDVKTHPADYEFVDFRPNVQKLFLAGAADTEHVAILWYTVEDGGVGLHYHAKTESVYVIDGTQTDAKGVYETGTVYFNPPGSGHEIKDSSGFFLLAYAAPPDFAGTDMIGEYTPVRIDTSDDDLTGAHAFEEQKAGIRTFAVPVDGDGGMSARLIEVTAADSYAYTGNYLLVVRGSCVIGGEKLGPNKLVVSKTVEPQPYEVSASKGGECLAMGVSF
jgi:ChrR Cupin-like domain